MKAKIFSEKGIVAEVNSKNELELTQSVGGLTISNTPWKVKEGDKLLAIVPTNFCVVLE